MSSLLSPLLSGAVRALSIDAVQKANSGHPGMPLGFADVASVLFASHLSFDPLNPSWPNRDRFVLSAGHGSMLLYSILHLLGVEELSLEQIKNFRQLGSLTPGHPEYGISPGVDTTTGPLGQGIANAVGMAIAERHLHAKLGHNIINHKTFVVAGDGCLMEGISQEAISLAGHLQLEKLTLLYDSNQISIDGSTNLAFSENVQERFHAASWHVQTVNGHNPQEINHALNLTQTQNKPHLIICNTTIGFGSPHKAGSHTSHGSPLGQDEISLTKNKLHLQDKPFFVEPEALSLWRKIGQQGSKAFLSWQNHIHSLPENTQKFIHRTLHALPSTPPENTLKELTQEFILNPPTIATRAASRLCLNRFSKTFPTLIGGSADLTDSNQTRADNIETLSPQNPSGHYIHYGVREHAMVAAMSGMALHGSIIPFGGTFLTFSDYARPALRLAALMEKQIILVGSHDSIGLGEDGPTHQPVEHLAALRAIPNLLVLRPADPIETAECWHIALTHTRTPSVIALSRQATPTLRSKNENHNLSAQGAYLLNTISTPSPPLTTLNLIASGTEVNLALKTALILASHHISSRIISVPCLDLFKAQPPAYQKTLLLDHPCIVIEAGISQGWEGFIAHNGLFFGLQSFGLSAPAKDLFSHFNLTPDAISHDILSHFKPTKG